MKRYTIILSAFLFICSGTVEAQLNDNGLPIKFKYGKYSLEASYDSVNYCSILTVSNSGKVIYKSECLEMITGIKDYNFSGDGNKDIVIEYYSGGAHCCFSLNICNISNDKFNILDSLYLGNSYYDVKDLDGNGELEIISSNDMFAYAFTNFSQSRFPITIYSLKNNKLKLANKEFEKEVLAHIKELQEELQEYTKSGFVCPSSADEETFNTDAGAVQAVLAPIVADYESIGMVNKGYELINKVYKCPDKDRFVTILKNDYKLK